MCRLATISVTSVHHCFASFFLSFLQKHSFCFACVIWKNKQTNLYLTRAFVSYIKFTSNLYFILNKLECFHCDSSKFKSHETWLSPQFTTKHERSRLNLHVNVVVPSIFRYMITVKTNVWLEPTWKQAMQHFEPQVCSVHIINDTHSNLCHEESFDRWWTLCCLLS